MNQFWKRSTVAAVLSASILVTSGGIGAQSASAAAPASPAWPVLKLLGKVQTTPFLNTNPAEKPGDIEGLAYDPQRKSMWMADDSKFQLYEVEFNPSPTAATLAASRHRKTITWKKLQEARPYLIPAGPIAGTPRASDFEALAMDTSNNVLYAFAGSCCLPGNAHLPTAFRLIRSNPADAASSFVVADYQPLEALAATDFSGAGFTAVGGVPRVWVANKKNLYPYDYATNTLGTPISLNSQLNGLGDINGLSFSDDSNQLWITTSSERIIRLTWSVDPVTNPPTIVPGYIFDPRLLNIRDTRAIEIVDQQVVLADGYDFHETPGIHEFALHVFDVTGSSPVPSFTAAPTTLGAGGIVTFQDTTTLRPRSITWNFGDGSPVEKVYLPCGSPTPCATDVLPNPDPPVAQVDAYKSPVRTHQYTTPGSYTVTLSAENQNTVGPAPAVTAQITVTTAPAASFTMTPLVGAIPLLVTFTDTSIGSPATAWAWNFGDSTTASTRNATHTYSTPGVYTVSFTASNDNGASTVTQQLTVEGPPVADFTMDSTSGIAPLIVNFDDISTGTPFITERKWEFGDGGVAYDADTAHVFEKGGQFTVKLTVKNARGTSVKEKIVTVVGTKFVGVNPVRLMDTRSGAPTIDTVAQGEGPLGPQSIRSLRIVNRGTSIPALGIGAVAINVTAISPNAPSYLTVWPSGATQPNASNLNFSAGQTIPNMVIVKVGANGQIDLFNESGSVDIAVDILGFFPEGPSFNGITPERFVDTRSGGRTVDSQYQASGAIGTSPINVKIAGRGSIPATGVGSVALNVTVTNPTANSYMTVWPKGQAQPNASNLNYTAGTTIPNMVIVPLSSSGEISIFNEAGKTDVIVDVLGWFPGGSAGSFVGRTPARVFDNRSPGGRTDDGVNAGAGVLGGGQETTFKILGRGGVPASGVGSVALNVTVASPTAESYLTVWPGGTARPNASNLNFTAGTTIPNMVIVPVGPKGEIGLFNAAGNTNIIVDVLGYFPALCLRPRVDGRHLRVAAIGRFRPVTATAA